MISLIHRIKDKHRLAKPAKFSLETTQIKLTEAIQAANERKQCQVDQKNCLSELYLRRPEWKFGRFG